MYLFNPSLSLQNKGFSWLAILIDQIQILLFAIKIFLSNSWYFDLITLLIIFHEKIYYLNIIALSELTTLLVFKVSSKIVIVFIVFSYNLLF